MQVISKITGEGIIKVILKHLDIWLVKSRPVPKAHEAVVAAYPMDDYTQLPMNNDRLPRFRKLLGRLYPI